MLLPPNMDSFAHRDSKTVCFGVNTLSELQDSMTWALRNFSRGGDSVRYALIPCHHCPPHALSNNTCLGSPQNAPFSSAMGSRVFWFRVSRTRAESGSI